MADEARKLLDHIVRRFVVPDELLDVDLVASASDLGDDIEADKRGRVRREQERADHLADAFAAGLARAYDLHRAGQAELSLDDRTPEENRIADALIGFLVSYHLASSRSEETEPNHYRYHVAVDWDRLRDSAMEAEIDFERAVGRDS
ncbi:MAG: hypothetical protein ACRDJH_08450 [Thermomicrobiales bacterium]